MKRLACLLVLNLFTGYHVYSQTYKNTIPLFDPENKADWYVYIEGAGKNKDSLGVFQVKNGMIYASGEKFGYIGTEKSYSNFYLTMEFKWGTKKYAPRLNEKRDAGILYHAIIYNGDKIWPRALECQIQEGDCGDIWLIDSASVTHADTITPKRNYHRVIKSTDAEKPTGVKGGNITYLVNGQVVNEAKNSSLVAGRILLQSEGAEIYYRNVRLQEL